MLDAICESIAVLTWEDLIPFVDDSSELSGIKAELLRRTGNSTNEATSAGEAPVALVTRVRRYVRDALRRSAERARAR